MSPYVEIILKTLPVISLFAIGAFLKRIRFFQEKTVADLKKLVVNITLPALLFLAFASMELKASFLLIVAAVFLVCLIMLFAGKAFGKLTRVSSPYFSFLMAGFETGMLGYAIYTAVFGVENIAKLAIIDLGQVLFVFFILMPMLQNVKGGAGKPKDIILSFLTSPVIISIFAGIAVSLINRAAPFFSNPAWMTVESIARLVGSVTTPVICIAIGYELQFSKDVIGKTLKTILVRYILLIGFALLLNKLLLERVLHLPKLYEFALMTMFLLPPPFVISVFMDERDTENVHYTATTLSISTIVSLGAFIVAMLFMQS